MFTAALNFNRRAAALGADCTASRWSATATSIVLRQLGSTYSLVDAEPNADAICAAIKTGRVEVAAQPLSVVVGRHDRESAPDRWHQKSGPPAGAGRSLLTGRTDFGHRPAHAAQRLNCVGQRLPATGLPAR